VKAASKVLFHTVYHVAMFTVFAAEVLGAEPVFMDFTNTPAAKHELTPTPESPREMFNLGTRQLRAGKLADSEALLQKALESQDERVQSPALFNLGHTRFNQGTELLKKSESGGLASARGRAAAQHADFASAEARNALAGEDLQRMLTAYLNGRGARKELKEATRAIRQALDIHGATLRRWQRSLDDFKSAAELNPASTNAQHNAQLVEREIVKLIDSIREMQQTAAQMAQSQKQLQEQMKQLGGKIPEPMMPPGAKGEDEEEDDGENGKEPPTEPQPGQQEKPGREGEEMQITPEEAGWLLEGFKLDSDRRLPMGQGEEAQPRDRKGRNW
jgi:tetratricopeptide (TPR) repeat protein